MSEIKDCFLLSDIKCFLERDSFRLQKEFNKEKEEIDLVIESDPLCLTTTIETFKKIYKEEQLKMHRKILALRESYSNVTCVKVENRVTESNINGNMVKMIAYIKTS